MIALQRQTQAAAVGVIGAQFALVHPQGVGGAGALRIRTAAAGERKSAFLEGQGDVEAAATVGKELRDNGFKILVLGKNALIIEGDAVVAGKALMDVG